MSTATGVSSGLSFPLPPADVESPEAMRNWLSQILLELQQWSTVIDEKITEFDALSTNGQGLGLTTYAASATVTKLNGSIVAFDGDPNAGVAGAGTPGLYRWNQPGNSWVKY